MQQYQLSLSLSLRSLSLRFQLYPLVALSKAPTQLRVRTSPKPACFRRSIQGTISLLFHPFNTTLDTPP